MSAQVTSVLARPVASMPLTRYVKGETRYMKIQKPGRAAGPASTLRKRQISLQYVVRRRYLPAEDQSQREEKLADVSGRFRAFHAGDDHVRKCRGE